MEVMNLTRKFQYNSIKLADPNPALTPDQVKEMYAATYPELNNSTVEGPTTKGGEAVYEFKRAVGSKGAALTAEEVVERTLAGDGSDLMELTLMDSELDAPVQFLAQTATQRTGTPALNMPSQAFGLWG
jgi:PRTRC genetic system protein C